MKKRTAQQNLRGLNGKKKYFLKNSNAKRFPQKYAYVLFNGPYFEYRDQWMMARVNSGILWFISEFSVVCHKHHLVNIFSSPLASCTPSMCLLILSGYSRSSSAMTSTAIVVQFTEALLIGATDIPTGEVRQKNNQLVA